MSKLYEYLEINFKEDREILNNIEVYYRSYPIAKKRGKLRWIDAPQKRLKEIQYNILYKFLYTFKPHDCAVGFRVGTGVGDGAALHLNNNVLLTMDIQNFFNSIKFYEVIKLCNVIGTRLNFEETSGEYNAIANFLCYKGQLPQGAPTSPAAANLVALRFDSILYKYAKEHGMTYTRYADDVTLSHPDKSYDIGQHVSAVEEYLKQFKWKPNYKKTRVLRPHKRMVVTGVVVNEKLGVARYKWRNLRAQLHNLKVSGEVISLKEYQKLRGNCEWIKSLNPHRGSKLIQQLGMIKYKNS